MSEQYKGAREHPFKQEIGLVEVEDDLYLFFNVKLHFGQKSLYL